ncbi:MAG: hypothetical protein PW788_03075 [Micavibrio sp.]|nr:hypothetical protein [Micavibrio sp.]
MSKWQERLDKLKWATTPWFSRKKKLAQAIAPLRQWPETAALLDFAESKGIPIKLSADLIGGQTAGYFTTDRNTGESHIALNPASTPADIGLVLIHELRHVWQSEMLGITPYNRHLEAADPETALFLVRVREADAYAFTNLMIARMRNAAADDTEARNIADRLEKANGGAPLDALQQQLLQEFMLEKFMKRLPQQQFDMAQDFLWAIENMDTYDRETIVDYHTRYTHPQYATEMRPEGTPLNTGDARKMLKLGVHENVPAYFNEVSDAQFRQAVLSSVTPEMKQAVNLIAAFEKAAARPGGIPPQGEQNFRLHVHNAVAEAVTRAPVPQSKSRFGA